MKIEAVRFDPAKEASTSYVDEVMLQRSNSWLAKQEQVTANIGNSNSPQLPRPNGSDSEGSSKVGTVQRAVGGASQRGGAEWGAHTPTGVPLEHGGSGGISGSRAQRPAAISPGPSQVEMDGPASLQARQHQWLSGEITQIDIDEAAEVDMDHVRHRACTTPPMSTSAVSSGGLVGHIRHRACPTPPMSTSAVSSGGLVRRLTSEPPLPVEVSYTI